MKRFPGFQARIAAAFLLLSLLITSGIAFTFPAKTALRGGIFSSSHALDFQYVLRVNSADAALFFPEYYTAVTLSRQEILRQDGNLFLWVQGSFASYSSKMFWLCARDWFTLTDGEDLATPANAFPDPGGDYPYRFVNEDMGFVLETDQPVTDMTDQLDYHLPVFYPDAVKRLGLLGLFELFFVLSILLVWRKSHFSPELTDRLRALAAPLPAALRRSGYRKYRNFYCTFTTFSLLFRLVLLLLLICAFVGKSDLVYWTFAGEGLLLLLIVAFLIQWIRLYLLINRCQLEDLKAILWSSTEPEFSSYLWDGFSVHKATKDFTLLSFLSQVLRLEGKPEQALELLDLCYQEAVFSVYRTKNAQYHCQRCQLLLDQKDYRSASHELVLLELALKQVRRPLPGERFYLRRIQMLYKPMLAMVEGRWEDAQALAAALRSYDSATPLGQVKACALQYQIAQATGDQALSQDCLQLIGHYAPGFAAFLSGETEPSNAPGRQTD